MATKSVDRQSSIRGPSRALSEPKPRSRGGRHRRHYRHRDRASVTPFAIEKSRKASADRGDEPTLTMSFCVNTVAAGRQAKANSSPMPDPRSPAERGRANVAMKVEDTEDADIFRVSGRGELHLTILVENMRREGYELAVGPSVCSR